MVTRILTLGKLLMVFCLPLFLVTGCSTSVSFTPLTQNSDDVLSGVTHSGVPELSLSAGDALGTMIVANHPVMLAKRSGTIQLAAN